jgi:hypothetical protein
LKGSDTRLLGRIFKRSHVDDFHFNNKKDGAEVTEDHRNAGSKEYATSSDFCRVYLEQMNRLYLLSLLLTADSQKAEQCFVSGFEDSASNNSVFKEWAHCWARRITIIRAIELLRPRPDDKNELNDTRLSLLNGNMTTQLRAYPNFTGIVTLHAFERFTFVMSVLEKYSVHECSLLLGCLRRNVIDARIAAIQHLATTKIATETHLGGSVVPPLRGELCESLALNGLVE